MVKWSLTGFDKIRVLVSIFFKIYCGIEMEPYLFCKAEYAALIQPPY
jgi:hypothetical protein